MGELPPKLFFRIGEVAGLVGVEPHVLRYWEREFRSIRPSKSAKGQRVYSRKDVENLLRVRDLLYRDGFTIAGAKKKLQRTGDVDEGSTDVMSADDPGEAFAPAPEPDAPGDDPTPTSLGDDATPTSLEIPRSLVSVSSPRVREKLVALKQEVEAFLRELSTTAPR